MSNKTYTPGQLHDLRCQRCGEPIPRADESPKIQLSHRIVVSEGKASKCYGVTIDWWQQTYKTEASYRLCAGCSNAAIELLNVFIGKDGRKHGGDL